MDIEKQKRDLAHIRSQIEHLLEGSIPDPRLPLLLEQEARLEQLIAEEESEG